MDQEEMNVYKAVKKIGIVLLALLVVSMIVGPPYDLWAAHYHRQVQVIDATAKAEAATELATAEVNRAKGVAEANRIIATSITEQYLRYLWITTLQTNDKEIIYVPTEANIPIMEAGRTVK